MENRRMDHNLELLKKGRLAEKRERFLKLLIRIDRIIQSIQLNTFRIHDEDLDSIKEEHVLAAAQELREMVKEARKLKAELED
jgi:hypothetical protein